MSRLQYYSSVMFIVVGKAVDSGLGGMGLGRKTLPLSANTFPRADSNLFHPNISVQF